MYWLDPCTYYSMILKEQRKENNMENKMGHFTGWKFGVPVRVTAKSHRDQAAVSGEIRLIDEDNSHFVLVNKKRGVCVICNKGDYIYELIPHKNLFTAFSPRYPVCQSPARTAYCNSGIGEPQMNQIDSCGTNDLSPYSTATLTVDGKTIELSA